MAYVKCPKCESKGKIPVEVKISRDTVGQGWEECDLCDGVGWLYEDATPEILTAIKGTNERLDKIKEILTKSQEAKQ